MRPRSHVAPAPGSGCFTSTRSKNIRRIWLTTTNDNMTAMTFNQRLGFRIVQVRPGAVDEARKFKPQIPQVSANGIPIRDEIVLALDLEPALNSGREAV